LSAQIAHAKSEQRIAAAELENTLIYAPINGTIVKIFARPGKRIGDNIIDSNQDRTTKHSIPCRVKL